MKKLSLAFGIALIVLIAIVGYNTNSRKDETPTAKDSAPRHVTPRERREIDTSASRVMRPSVARTESDGDEIESLRRELKTAKAKLERITRPLGQDVLSSTVNAEINPGETLVTGGYKTADGNYEMTFITPSSYTLDDGREAIRISSKVLSVGSEFVEANGMETLATNAKNTLQHSEAWTQDDLLETFTAASKAKGVDIFTSPTIVAIPSEAFTLVMGKFGGAQFSIEGTATKSPNGSFAIQTRVERTPAAEPDTPR